MSKLIGKGVQDTVLGGVITINTTTDAVDILGTLTITDDFTVDTTTLFVDASTSRVGIGTITPSVQLHLLENANSTPLEFLVQNNKNQATSDSRIQIKVAGNSGQDPYLSLVAGSNGWNMGLDNDDSDKLKFDYGADTIMPGDATMMTITVGGNVGIGNDTPTASSLLDLASTTGALLLSRMTTTQRDALTAINGMCVYNSTTNAFNFYENGSWVTK